VLHTFALGGQATDDQIRAWADMPPKSAIVEMLTFDEHNAKLSPVGPEDTDRLDTRDGTLYGLSGFWTSDDPANGVPEARRDEFEIDNHLQELWAMAATNRGLNPFRHRVGLWETNYHLAVNLERRCQQTSGCAVLRRYSQRARVRRPYQEVLSTAALSAAVATQYGHRHNRYRNDVCECNEDFAREYFQLFFGILGEDDPDYHETVTIKDMAAALTDMDVPSENGLAADYVIFGTAEHYPGTLQILRASIDGTTAQERVEALSPIAIQHTESLSSLPVKIVSDLADDAMTDTKARQIREAWADMPEKNLPQLSPGLCRVDAVPQLGSSQALEQPGTSSDDHEPGGRSRIRRRPGRVQRRWFRDGRCEGLRPDPQRLRRPDRQGRCREQRRATQSAQPCDGRCVAIPARNCRALRPDVDEGLVGASPRGTKTGNSSCATWQSGCGNASLPTV
jgi:hypothetical protein